MHGTQKTKSKFISTYLLYLKLTDLLNKGRFGLYEWFSSQILKGI